MNEEGLLMKVTVLADNKNGSALKGEWGLSFYIEFGNKTVLLDTGLSGLFTENAAKLGCDLDRVDFGVLSHAHDDHANGMDTFFEKNDHAPFYVAHDCEENCYDRKKLLYKYAGIPKGILKRHGDRIVRAEKDMMIDEGIRLLGHTAPGLEEKGRMERMYLRKGFFTFIPDDFRHEQSLVFELPEGIAIFNSCSHAGADVIINEVMQAYPGKNILAMTGGFHLYNKSEEYVRAFAGRVRETGAGCIYTGHCTGQRQMKILKEELGDMVHELHTGMVFTI